MAKRPTPERLNQLMWGYSVPIMIDAAVHHRVFDVLDGGAKTLDQIAAATGANPRGLRSLLNGLVGLDLLAKRRQKYSLAPDTAAFLVRGKPGFLGGMLGHLVQQLIPKWLQLRQVVQTGKPAMAVNQQGTGADFFATFVEDIFPMSYPAACVLAASLAREFRSNGSAPVRVLDIAAGSGVWGIALAQKIPTARITAVDWEGVVPVTHRVAHRHGVGDRLTTVAGDLLTAEFGTGYHIATLGHILHSEGSERSRQLLARVFAALEAGGTIAISEFVANNDRTGPARSMIFSVNMLVNTEEGDTFTFPEISGWLKAAGFNRIRQLNAPAPSPLILANKPGKKR